MYNTPEPDPNQEMREAFWQATEAVICLLAIIPVASAIGTYHAGTSTISWGSNKISDLKGLLFARNEKYNYYKDYPLDTVEDWVEVSGEEEEEGITIFTQENQQLLEDLSKNLDKALAQKDTKALLNVNELIKLVYKPNKTIDSETEDLVLVSHDIEQDEEEKANLCNVASEALLSAILKSGKKNSLEIASTILQGEYGELIQERLSGILQKTGLGAADYQKILDNMEKQSVTVNK